MSRTFDEYFDNGELEARIESVLAQAREDKSRLEIEVRVEPEDAASRVEHNVRVDNTAASSAIVSRLKTECEASPGSNFIGRMRMNFRPVGNTAKPYTSYTHTIAGPAKTKPGAPYDINSLLQHLDAQTRRSDAAALRMAEAQALTMENAAKLVAAVTPQKDPPPSNGWAMAAPLLTALVKRDTPPATTSVPSPAPHSSLTPAAPADAAPEQTEQQKADSRAAQRKIIKDWCLANKEDAAMVIKELMTELPPDELAALMS